MAIVSYTTTNGTTLLKATARDLWGRQRAKRGFPDSEAGRIEAQAWIDTQVHQRDQRVAAPMVRGVPKFGTFVHDALVDHRVRDSTRNRYEGSAATHLVPVLGGIRLNKITAKHCQAAINNATHYARGEPLAPTSKHQLAAALMVIMAVAQKRYSLLENPARGLVLPEALRREKIRHFEAEQARALLDAAPNRRTRLIYEIGLTTGLRMGELLAIGVHRGDIDLARGRYFVERQVVGDGYGEARVTEQLKTRKSRRTVPMSRRTRAAFIELMEMTPKGPFCLAPRGAHKGELQSRRSAYSVWWDTLERAGLPKGGLHAMRHTYASVLLADPKVSILVVSRRLGHASVEETTSTYGHLMNDSDEIVAAALDAWLDVA